MNNVEYLDLEDILHLVRLLGIGPVRDVGLLDSAVARPRSSAFGEDAYPSISLKAAALLHSITNSHALVDGNKRLAWLCTKVFLALNGQRLEATADEGERFMLDLVAGHGELPTIADWLRDHSTDAAAVELPDDPAR